jgi:hypothetical protein
MDLILRFHEAFDLSAATDTKLDTSSQAAFEPRFHFSFSIFGDQQALFDQATKPQQLTWSVEHDLWGLRPGPEASTVLWASLPPSVQDNLGRGWNAGDWLRIVSGPNSTNNLPWEVLASVQGFEGRVSRLVPVRLVPPPLTAQPPVKVLIVVANPKDERVLDVGTELPALQRGLSNNQRYDVHVLQEATRGGLAAQLHSIQPHVLHYLGHSGIDRAVGNLVLHDSSTQYTDWLSALDLAQLLPVSVRLVCLSTGFTRENYNVRGLSAFAHTSASVRLPTCIVNRFSVDQPLVETFWHTFYTRLFDTGGDVASSFASGQQAAQSITATLDWASFSLIVRDGGDHPLRLAAQDDDPNRFANEVQAQFASRIATELADRVAAFGDGAPKALVDSFSQEQDRFVNFTTRSFTKD